MEKKLRIWAELTATSLELMRAVIKSENPEASEEEISRELLRRVIEE